MVLLDTSFIYAFFNEVDEFHGMARDLMQNIEGESIFISFVDVSLMILAQNLEAKVLTFDKKLAEALG